MGEKHCHNESCVCKSVKKIIEAQDKVAEKAHDRTCGCEQSIRDLLKPASCRPDSKTTIPLILYCKGSCKPYIAEVVEHAEMECFDQKYYRCLKSPFLKAKKMLPGSKCCVIAEILIPCNANGMQVTSKGDNLSDFLCEEAPFKTIQFRETGVCLTINLNDFSGIRCLAPVTPLKPV